MSTGRVIIISNTALVLVNLFLGVIHEHSLCFFYRFWEGHDPLNNLLTNAIKDYLDSEAVIVDPKEADICFVTIYGRSHMSILSEFTNKSILLKLGENKRPNTYPCRFSISLSISHRTVVRTCGFLCGFQRSIGMTLA